MEDVFITLCTLGLGGRSIIIVYVKYIGKGMVNM